MLKDLSADLAAALSNFFTFFKTNLTVRVKSQVAATKGGNHCHTSQYHVTTASTTITEGTVTAVVILV